MNKKISLTFGLLFFVNQQVFGASQFVRFVTRGLRNNALFVGKAAFLSAKEKPVEAAIGGAVGATIAAAVTPAKDSRLRLLQNMAAGSLVGAGAGVAHKPLSSLAISCKQIAQKQLPLLIAQAEDKPVKAAVGATVGGLIAYQFAGQEDGFFKKTGKVLAGAGIGAVTALNHATIMDKLHLIEGKIDGVSGQVTELSSNQKKGFLDLKTVVEKGFAETNSKLDFVTTRLKRLTQVTLGRHRQLAKGQKALQDQVANLQSTVNSNQVQLNGRFSELSTRMDSGFSSAVQQITNNQVATGQTLQEILKSTQGNGTSLRSLAAKYLQ